MGELARKPGCPKVAETPLELLTPRPGEGFSQLQKQAWQAGGVIVAVASSFFLNYVLKRPWFAGMPRHVVAAGLGYFSTTLIIDSSYAERSDTDAVLRHYISLHPEDFPPFERKRWGEVYIPFNPRR